MNLWSSSRRKLCQSLPMQYMGLWLQVRFEDFILSWKTSTHFCEFCALSFTSKYVQRRKERQRWIHWSFIWSKTPMKNIVAIGLSALKVLVLFPILFFEECVCRIIYFELTDFVYIHVHVNDIFIIYMLKSYKFALGFYFKAAR